MSRLERDEIATPSEDVLNHLATALGRPRTEVYLAAGRITPELALLIEKGLPVSIKEVARSLQGRESELEYTLEKIGYMPEVDHYNFDDDPDLKNMMKIGYTYVSELIHAVLTEEISDDQFAHAIESIRQLKMALLSKPPQKETP